MHIYERIEGSRPIARFEDLNPLRILRRIGNFVRLQQCMITPSGRFEQRNIVSVWVE